MQSEQTNEPTWQFNPEGKSVEAATSQIPQTPQVSATQNEVSWSASEFIAYHKPIGWYGAVILATAVFAVILYVLTDDYFAVGTIVAVAVLFLAYSNRKPRVLTYSIKSTGVQIGSKTYPYAEFRSFSIQQQGNMHVITLVPLQRLKPSIDLYYDPADEQKIIESLSIYLPHEERQMDIVDKFLHRIKF